MTGPNNSDSVGRASRPTDSSAVGRALSPTRSASAPIIIPRGYRELRIGRVSLEHADYFLTIGLRRPACGLATPEIAQLLNQEFTQLETNGTWHLRTSVIMPDHLHLVVTLLAGELSAAVRLMKGRSAHALRLVGLHWQPSFHDRRLRDEQELAAVFRYVLLNPYRRGLLRIDESWPAYYCCPTDREWFEASTDHGRPFAEWLEPQLPNDSPFPWTKPPESRA